MDTFIDQTDLGFATLTFFEDYIISEVQEGTSVGKYEVKMGDQALKQFYGDKRFGYISYRKYDYNVNPLEYLNCNLEGQLKGFAFVCRNEASKKTAEFEKAFYRGGYRIFLHLDDAIVWVKSLD